MTNTNKLHGFILIENTGKEDKLVNVNHITLIEEGVSIVDGFRKAATYIYIDSAVVYISTFESMENVIKKIAEAQQ